MDRIFDPDQFIARIGKRLVEQFNDARAATSPGTVGDAMEQPVRNQLEQILPRGIAVGEGFVIDSEGGTSRQTDVILYEKDTCPRFSVNNTPETTYYPCEGVIAVGEVKSSLDRQSLRDSFEKIASVKGLQRRAVHGFMPHPTSGRPIVQQRSYGSLQSPSIIDITEKKESDTTDQIFGFVLAGELRVSQETFLNAFRELTREIGDRLALNMVIVLSGGLLTWGNFARVKNREIKWFDHSSSYGVTETPGRDIGWEPNWSAQGSSVFKYSPEGDAFRTLIQWLRRLYQTGKTSDASAFDHYFQHRTNPSVADTMYVPKRGTAIEELIQRARTGT